MYPPTSKMVDRRNTHICCHDPDRTLTVPASPSTASPLERQRD
jgi:hypothetical protein